MRPLFIYLIVFALIAALGGGLFYAQKSVEAEVVSAIERADIDALAARVDFEALRAFLKEDIRRQKTDTSPLGRHMTSAGPSIDKIDAVVDYYVQPANIEILYYMRNSAAADVPVQSFVVSRGYAPPYGFALTFGAPPELVQDSAAKLAAERYKVRAVFGLSGFKWKITELHAPLFMVPRTAYSQPAVDIFAPKRR